MPLGWFFLSPKPVLGQRGHFFFTIGFFIGENSFKDIFLIALISQPLFQSCNLIFHLTVTALTGTFQNTLKHIPPIIGYLSNCWHWWMVLISTCWFDALLLNVWVAYSRNPLKYISCFFVISSNTPGYVISCQIT